MSFFVLFFVSNVIFCFTLTSRLHAFTCKLLFFLLIAWHQRWAVIAKALHCLSKLAQHSNDRRRKGSNIIFFSCSQINKSFHFCVSFWLDFILILSLFIIPSHLSCCYFSFTCKFYFFSSQFLFCFLFIVSRKCLFDRILLLLNANEFPKWNEGKTKK